MPAFGRISSYFTVVEYGVMYSVVPVVAKRTLPFGRVRVGVSLVQRTFEEPFCEKQYWFS